MRAPKPIEIIYTYNFLVFYVILGLLLKWQKKSH